MYNGFKAPFNFILFFRGNFSILNYFSIKKLVVFTDSPSLQELDVSLNTYTPGQTGQLSGLVQLLQSNKLTKLDLVGCHFNLQGTRDLHVSSFNCFFSL